MINCVSCWMSLTQTRGYVRIARDQSMVSHYYYCWAMCTLVWGGRAVHVSKNSISTWSNEKRIRAEQDFPVSDDVKCWQRSQLFFSLSVGGLSTQIQCSIYSIQPRRQIIVINMYFLHVALLLLFAARIWIWWVLHNTFHG